MNDIDLVYVYNTYNTGKIHIMKDGQSTSLCGVVIDEDWWFVPGDSVHADIPPRIAFGGFHSLYSLSVCMHCKKRASRYFDVF